MKQLLLVAMMVAAGCKVVVTGEIVEYKGDLELVPGNIEAIRIESTPAK